MVAPPELSRALERHEVIGLFDHAEYAAVPTDIGADAAGVYLGDIEADAAVDDLRLELRQRLGQRLHLVRRALEKKEGQPLSGLGAYAREPLQRFNEPRDRLGVVGHLGSGGEGLPSWTRPPHPALSPNGGEGYKRTRRHNPNGGEGYRSALRHDHAATTFPCRGS